MKTSQLALTLPLMLFAANAFAAAVDQKPMDEKMQMGQEKVDHSGMEMGKDKPAQHTMTEVEFGKLDQNQDGKISKAEFPSTGPMAAHFTSLDSDKNGELSKAEFLKEHTL